MYDFKAVADLLAVITEPAKYKALFDALRVENDQAESVKADRAAAEKIRGEARRISDETKHGYEGKLAAIAARENTVSGKERDLADKASLISRRDGACNNRESDLTSREGALSTAQRALAERERKLEETATRVVAEESAWNEKVRAIKGHLST